MTGPGDPRPFADLQKLQDQPAAPAPEEPEPAPPEPEPQAEVVLESPPPPMTGRVDAQPQVTDPREPARSQEGQQDPAEPPPVAAEQDQQRRAAEPDTWGKPAEER